MQIDHCLILSAGFGTRMGVIGQTLPKILWPVFEKTLLELQIEYAKNWGCRNIYVNSHFLHQKVFQRFKNLSDKKAVLVHEPVLLGSGGSIHNIARLDAVKKKGILLVVNGDQFFFPNDKLISFAMEEIKKHPAILFSVEIEGKYGEVVIEDDLLVKIVQPTTKKRHLTYSGVGLINLAKLALISGASDFFMSVADFKNKKIPMLSGKSEFWDFGTFERYYYSMFDLLGKAIQKKKSCFVKFCFDQKGLLKEKINYKTNSYHHNASNTINLSSFPVKNPSNGQVIVLSSKKSLDIGESGIYYEDITEKVGH